MRLVLLFALSISLAFAVRVEIHDNSFKTPDKDKDNLPVKILSPKRKIKIYNGASGVSKGGVGKSDTNFFGRNFSRPLLIVNPKELLKGSNTKSLNVPQQKEHTLFLARRD